MLDEEAVRPASGYSLMMMMYDDDDAEVDPSPTFRAKICAELLDLYPSIYGTHSVNQHYQQSTSVQSYQ